jgi:hypothetical protein
MMVQLPAAAAARFTIEAATSEFLWDGERVTPFGRWAMGMALSQQHRAASMAKIRHADAERVADALGAAIADAFLADLADFDP